MRWFDELMDRLGRRLAAGGKQPYRVRETAVPENPAVGQERPLPPGFSREMEGAVIEELALPQDFSDFGSQAGIQIQPLPPLETVSVSRRGSYPIEEGS